MGQTAVDAVNADKKKNKLKRIKDHERRSASSTWPNRCSRSVSSSEPTLSAPTRTGAPEYDVGGGLRLEVGAVVEFAAMPIVLEMHLAVIYGANGQVIRNAVGTPCADHAGVQFESAHYAIVKDGKLVLDT